MTVPQKIKDLVEANAASLTKKDFLRPGSSYNEFVKELSELLAQAKADQAALAAAGFNVELISYYDALLEILVLEHAKRVNAEADMSASKGAFADAMPRAERNKALLMAVGRYVVTRDDNGEAKRVYDWVRKGRGDVDTLNDIVSMVSFIRRWKDLASEVSPGGETLDEARLTVMETEALDLLRVRAEAATSSDAAAALVDRQARIITLCVQARSEIKLFAEMAFYNDIDRYRRFYATPSPRAAAVPSEPVAENAAPAS